MKHGDFVYAQNMKDNAFLASLPTLAMVGVFFAHMLGFLSIPFLSTF